VAADSDRSGAYLVFVWKSSGYELHERRGEPPAVGAEIEQGETRLRVSKIGPSPLPGDPRPCAYTNAIR
jgi:hypothetical protein